MYKPEFRIRKKRSRICYELNDFHHKVHCYFVTFVAESYIG
jgi:hypothetical protein